MTHGQTGKIKLLEFKYSDCDKATLSNRIRTRIIKKDIEGDILTVNIATVATCCVEFDPITSTNQGVLYLDFRETGTPCECDCFYSLTYKIKGIKDTEIKIKFRNKDIELSDEKFNTYPIKFKILNGDTVNFTDKYGMRQGVCTFYNDSLMTKGYLEIANDTVFKMVNFYPNNRIVKDIFEKSKPHMNYTSYLEYFESGKIKKECVSKDVESSFRDNGMCKEWNEAGDLVYEGKYRK